MKHKFLSVGMMEHTSGVYLSTISLRSQFIYCSVLLAIIMALAALPFIYVPVSIQANGLIRPVTEKAEIKSLVAGTIDSIAVREGEALSMGQPVVFLQSNIIESRGKLNRLQLDQKLLEIKDLIVLSKLHNRNYHPDTLLQSAIYKKQFSEFEARLEDISVSEKKLKRDLAIKQRLYDDGKVISLQELEDKRYELNKISASYTSLFMQQVMNWQNELTNRKMESQQLQAEGYQLQLEKQYNSIVAPVKGTIQQINGRYKGAFIQAGETIAVISPDSTLIGECYVSPADIGLLKRNMKVQIQVDAYNYNSWGSAMASITEIGNDFMLVNNQPMFVVRCRLVSDSLKLKNGYTAFLKKGMTFHCRFVITTRSLWQLLYDNMDNWLNPAVK